MKRHRRFCTMYLGLLTESDHRFYVAETTVVPFLNRIRSCRADARGRTGVQSTINISFVLDFVVHYTGVYPWYIHLHACEHHRSPCAVSHPYDPVPQSVAFKTCQAGGQEIKALKALTKCCAMLPCRPSSCPPPHPLPDGGEQTVPKIPLFLFGLGLFQSLRYRTSDQGGYHILKL